MQAFVQQAEQKNTLLVLLKLSDLDNLFWIIIWIIEYNNKYKGDPPVLLTSSCQSGFVYKDKNAPKALRPWGQHHVIALLLVLVMDVACILLVVWILFQILVCTTVGISNPPQVSLAGNKLKRKNLIVLHLVVLLNEVAHTLT